MSQTYRQVKSIVPLLWSSVILFSGLLLFKVANTILESRMQGLEEAENSSTLNSGTLGSTAETSYFEVF